MEYINLIKTLTTELENAKNKIHTLKVKLSTKELDIMNLKKEQICLILEYNEYKNKQEQQDQQQEEILEQHQDPVTVNNTNIYITPKTEQSNNISCNITDSLLLARKNKLKTVDPTVVNNKYKSTGISKSIIMNQRNNLKNVIINSHQKIQQDTVIDCDYTYMINAIISKRSKESDVSDDLTESWL